MKRTAAGLVLDEVDEGWNDGLDPGLLRARRPICQRRAFHGVAEDAERPAPVSARNDEVKAIARVTA